MPGDDLLIGTDGDFVDDGAGGFEFTPTAQPAIRHQVLDRIGEWLGDPTAGREIAGLKGRLNTEEELDEEADSVRNALEKLERDGLITDIQIATDRDPAGRWGLRITCRDTASGGTIAVDTLTEFGES